MRNRTFDTLEVVSEVVAEVVGEQHPAGVRLAAQLPAQELDGVLQESNVGDDSLHHHHLQHKVTSTQ